jgi:NADH dehydrogenase (ubiquinone) Fe-S protein 3
MASRLAVGRPLGAAVRSATCFRAAMRTFTSTALRAKQVAAEDPGTPNMRVRWNSRQWRSHG